MTTDFTQIIFNPDAHTYTYQGKDLLGVTKLIKQLQKPFNGSPARQARERGVSEAVILAEWKQAAEEGRERGRQTHQYICRVLGSLPDVSDRFLSLTEKLPEMSAFDSFWSRVKDTVQVVWVEKVVGDEMLGIAGTLDTVLLDNQVANMHLMWDWKTGKKFRLDNPFQKLNPPFADLDDCELIIYSLQTSLYRLIVERNTSLEFSQSYLLHLSPQGTFNVYPAIDYRARLLEWLENA